MILTRGESPGTMKPAEVQEFIGWYGEARARTSFDIGIIGYPRCAMLMAENGEGNIAYLPVQTVLMAEVFVPKPGSTEREKAASLGKFDAALLRIARGMSVGDVYTYVPDEEEDYIQKIIHHGWVETPGVRLFKKRAGVPVGRT